MKRGKLMLPSLGVVIMSVFSFFYEAVGVVYLRGISVTSNHLQYHLLCK